MSGCHLHKVVISWCFLLVREFQLTQCVHLFSDQHWFTTFLVKWWFDFRLRIWSSCFMWVYGWCFEDRRARYMSSQWEQQLCVNMSFRLFTTILKNGRLFFKSEWLCFGGGTRLYSLSNSLRVLNLILLQKRYRHHQRLNLRLLTPVELQITLTYLLISQESLFDLLVDRCYQLELLEMPI